MTHEILFECGDVMLKAEGLQDTNERQKRQSAYNNRSNQGFNNSQYAKWIIYKTNSSLVHSIARVIPTKLKPAPDTIKNVKITTVWVVQLIENRETRMKSKWEIEMSSMVTVVTAVAAGWCRIIESSMRKWSIVFMEMRLVRYCRSKQ